jgi:diaminopimelate decarboxylase
MTVTLLHAHIGSGPTVTEFTDNMQHLANFFAGCLEAYPHVQAVNFGGGIPHPYLPGAPSPDFDAFGHLLREAQVRFSNQTGHTIRVEIEPGRYFVAPAAYVITRVTDVKRTRANAKGPGQTFVMVDAGFCDLIRPAMYGAFHQISVWNAPHNAVLEPTVIAGPLCESGDVFTRDEAELLQPRALPAVQIGDLLLLHDAGAYGYTMSSNYNSLGRAPQVWLENGLPYLISRRETFEDIIRTECFTAL